VKTKILTLCAYAGVCLATASATTIQVTSGSPENWTFTNSDPSVSQTFVNGPAPAPLGTGSLHVQIGADGDQYTIARNDADVVGTALSAVTALSYSTYESDYVDGQAIYLSLILSNNDRLYFEPVYQTGTYGGDPVPNQCAAVPNCAGLNQWQTWNALAGGWWSNDGYGGSNGGPPNFTLATYAADHSGVTISAIRLVAGGGAGAWDNFDGNVDNLRIATAASDTTWDFEPSAATPEPGTVVLMLGALFGIAVVSRRRQTVR
jgi:hypothetical protein